jgi:hypothetical protein
MNNLILNQYGITFQKQSNGNIKINATSRNLDNFMYMFCRDKQRLQRFVIVVNQVLNDGYNTISEHDKNWDIEIGSQVYTGVIYSITEFDLYFEEEENETFPLNDIKEIFESLLEFIA